MATRSLIFFDIDGTLLDEHKQLPQTTKEAVFRLKEAGHIVAIATGRAPFMYEDLRKELDIDSYVSYNGSYVVIEGEVIFKNALHKPDLLALAKEGLANDHPIVFMDEYDMRANVPNHNSINESIESLKIGVFPSYDPLYHEGRDLYQSLFFCTEDELQSYEQNYPSFDFVRWHPLSVDVLPSGGSKAKGIQEAVKRLGFDEDHVYAFGDGLNDVEMLTSVKNSVAMGNGVPEAKEVASFVTKDVADDGLLHGIKEMGLL
ncbi:hypothetical protein SAMN05421734_106164 [Pelagirhabdus alkalitolerans]|uniref:Cof subfamily of IIB subfamily of haloacid dehalogenase superfamily/HAD-superfamily hydrolase, subfamily IIB n=1 Tax=Pelagirhabdus alkalitolerans TaxID=1612202 RepID=A0A1G6KQ97_9BACI|nr:Cof-type HAD-IIB family hydrolase [Pelagirhabdus alkalitolerans]SDC32998.1 hypothetical protein SAMN05421734_106164 [Pelagirhabdus alkalitolerans]